MPRYTFVCASDEHDASRHGETRFEQFIQHSAAKRVDQTKCRCGARAKRDFTGDIQTIGVVGMTPISHTSTGRGSAASETEFAFGRHKTNPDGSVNHNERPFRDTGELQRYMNGANELGSPVVDDNGNPVRRKDGSIVRQGAKLFKYGPNATPSRDGVRRRGFRPPRNVVLQDGWGDERDTMRSVQGASTLTREQMAKTGIPTGRHSNPQRRAKA